MTRKTIVMLGCLLMLLGCEQRATTERSGSPLESAVAPQQAGDSVTRPAIEVDRKDASERDSRRAVAFRAKDALVAALSNRLAEVLKSDGPVVAIEVCSQEARQIAKRVGQEHGVEIGRTSFKLRNPDNAPRAWVVPLVEQRIDSAHAVDMDNGGLGMVFPILLDVKCLMCHGGTDDLLDAVKPELAARYPNDAATGFAQGDLRGWFWVEVPPG